LPPVSLVLLIPVANLPPVSLIFASQGAPPVSTTPVANFATRFASVIDTVGKFVTGVNVTGGVLPPVSKKRHQGQFAAGVVNTISGFRDLKVNLKVKMYL
jgi:hypothetical protein